MELLSLRKGSTLNKDQFLNHLYGGIDEPELKIIDVFICKLRKSWKRPRAAKTTSKPSGGAAMSCVIRTKNLSVSFSSKKPRLPRGFRHFIRMSRTSGGNALSGTAGMQADAVDVKTQLVHRPLPLFLVFGLKQQVR